MTILKTNISKTSRNESIIFPNLGNGGSSSSTIVVGSNINVIDDLNSTSATDALSANQGRLLNITDDNIIKQNDCINLSSLIKSTIIDINLACHILVAQKNTFNYDLHPGMLMKFKLRDTGEWLTYIYTGSNVEYNNEGNWSLHLREKPVLIADNLLTDDPDMALSARLGKILNEIKPTKTANEVIDGRYDFTNGIDTNGLTTENFINSTDYSEQYNHGMSIYPVRINDNNGDWIDTKWNMIIDNLKVRDTLDVFTLLIEEARAIAGAIYCTKAGMKVDKVSEDQNIWRCYFNDKDEDGNVVKYQLFRTDDLAFCQIFDGKNVKKYWYKVTGTNLDLPDYKGDPFIDLKKPEVIIANAVPAEGDEIVQLGNMSDPERQGALVIEPLQMSVYNNIKNTVLPEPVIRLSPKNTKINADMINFIGKTIINGNFVVDDKGNLTVKGKINADSGNIGRFDITNDGLFNDADANGLGQITIQDESKGIGFKLGTDYDTLLTTCYITNDNKTALRTDSNEGIALIAGHETTTSETPQQSERIGLKVYNGTELLGVKLNVKVSSTDYTLNNKKDDVLFMTPPDGNKIVTLPNPKIGKIFTIHNSSEYVVRIVKTWLKDKYGKDVTGDYYRLNKGETLKVCAVTNQYYYVY